MFGTVGMTAFVLMPISTIIGVVSKGSARILATARAGIICSTYLTDAINFVPAGMTALTVVEKKTQKGD